MAKLTIEVPTVGEKNTVAEPKVDTALKAIETWANGEIGTGNIAAEGVSEAMLAKALQEKLTTKVGLTLVKQKGSTTGVTENLYLMEEAATTLTLPAATLNRFIGITCNNGVASVKVKASAGLIFGDFLTATGVTEVALSENQHILVEADGTNWRIVAGEPKRESKYSAQVGKTVNTEYEVSATRPALVSLQIEVKVAGTSVSVSVRFEGDGATQITAVSIPASIASGTFAYSFWLQPGMKWHWTLIGEAVVNESHLVL